MPSEIVIKGRSHLLCECGISFFAADALVNIVGNQFPQNIANAPLLLPGEDSVVRKRLMQWFSAQHIQPLIIGEFDDSALMRAFGQEGVGIFTSPTMIDDEVQQQHHVVKIGQTEDVIERFYAISVERRANHPAVVAINAATFN
jgi:LysR family transcriptional activator of nhaA